MNALADELTLDPLGIGYAAMSDAERLAALSAPTRVAIEPTDIGYGAILSTLGAAPGAAVLDTLEALAATNSPVKWALRLLAADNLNVGDAVTRAQIDALAAAGVLTGPQADAIKALAERPISRLYELGIPAPSWAKLDALRSPT